MSYPDNSQIEFSRESILYMKMLAKRCGIDLGEYRKEALYNRLVKRLRALGLDDFDSYCQRLRVDLDEEVKFINLITNPTTSFFREIHHFNYLKNEFLPELIKKKRRIRIWSAGCSTGEEAYSISMILHEVIPAINSYDIKILATDINSESLSTAEIGVYDKTAITQMSLARRNRWFHDADTQMENKVQIDVMLKKFITFRQLNLMEPWPFHGLFDLILCRNVLIYFKLDTCERILNKFTNLLDVGGVLMLGHSENLLSSRDYYTLIGNTMYKKIKTKDECHEKY